MFLIRDYTAHIGLTIFDTEICNLYSAGIFCTHSSNRIA